MPAKSRAQFRFMKGVEKGNIKEPGLPPSKAGEFTQGADYSTLPERAGKTEPMKNQRRASKPPKPKKGKK